MYDPFGSPDFGHSDATKIFVRRNDADGPPKEVRLPPGSKLQDLFEKACKALDIDAPQKAFYSNGVEITDVDHVEDGEVIHISCGEPFRAGEAEAGTQVVANFILHGKLGQGGFGSVVKGVHSETREVAAVKFVPKKSFRQFSDLQRVFQEIQALRNLRHPNVIRILDVADHPDNVCFIMEFAAGGELRGYVEQKKALSEEEARQFFKQIVRAVHYVHSKKIIHRDLKLENILLDANNRCKIVDFGLSDYVSSKEATVTDAGTEAYLAPEVFNGSSGASDPYKIDVWSLGVILYALVHGKLPFTRPDVETCARLEEEGLAYDAEVSPGYKRLVAAMLTPCPERRASVDQITIDPWVTKHRFAEGLQLDGEQEEEEEGGAAASAEGGADAGAAAPQWESEPTPKPPTPTSPTLPEAGQKREGRARGPSAKAAARSTSRRAAGGSGHQQDAEGGEPATRAARNLEARQRLRLDSRDPELLSPRVRANRDRSKGAREHRERFTTQ
mmetsp:Transcript_17071/g.48586  ORF Transcript_17071/g.48586 Transcript_17071/m.48586 type:complete len:502 (-) Transcript_17071:130-1635(-)